MKIGVVVNNYPSERHPSQGAFVYRMVQELSASGCEVEVACVRPWWEQIGRPRLRKEYGCERARVTRCACTAIPLLGRYVDGIQRLNTTMADRAIQRISAGCWRDLDIVYAHFLGPACAAATVARNRRCPFVISLGESDFPKAVRSVGLSRAKAVCGQAERIISVNRTIAVHLTDVLKIAQDKVEVLPNGVDAKAMSSGDRHTTRRWLGISESDFVVLFLGRRVEHKGVRLLDEALQDQDSALKSIFIGAGSYIPTHSGRVLYGPVPVTEVPDYLAASDVLVLPTNAEGSCNAILEACAAGKPVITTAIPEILEDVGTEAVYYLSERSVPAIRSAIDQLRTDPNRRRLLTEAGLRLAGKRSIARRASRLAEILQNAAEGAASDRPPRTSTSPAC